ncbi:MAG: LpqB family beta-propeller domain-containing protein, partial [Acidobacteriota bacterium]
WAALPLSAQAPPPKITPGGEDIQIVIKGHGDRRLAVAVPPLSAPGTAALQAKVTDPFTATLRADLEYAGAFAVTDPAHYPSGFRDPTAPEAADRWLGTGAEALVDTRGEITGDQLSVEARVWDLKSRKLIMGRKYRGGASYVDRIAHTLANDLVKYFTGKPGAFLSTILFVAEQGAGIKEVMAMDFDGRNARQLTSHKSITINPSAAAGKVAYTSYVRLFPQIWTMGLDGSDKKEIATGVELNASPSVSPDAAQVAFVGSTKGNTDIYTMGVHGGSPHRLTTTRALEASPAWSPTGRQILYTSDLTGTPQIYVMDAEGAGSKRVTFAGNWNDEGSWSPDGARIAFACRNEGDFNICVMDLGTGQTVQVTSEGSNGHPSWSPDGEKIVYSSRRGGSTQIYSMDSTGQNKRQLIQGGSHFQPVWLP